MSFKHINKGSFAEWLWYVMVVTISRACSEPVIQTMNKQRDIWRNKKGALAGFLLYAIIVVVLIIVLIVVLRFLLVVI